MVAHQAWQGLSAAQVEHWIGVVGASLAPSGQWRLLFSSPQQGPAAGLLALLGSPQGPLGTLLDELVTLERQQLELL